MKPIDNFKKRVDASRQHVVDSTINDLKADLRNEKLKYKELLADHLGFKKSCGWLDIMANEYSQVAPIRILSKTGTSEGTAIAVGGDWHVFESVKPEQVNGLNEYNPEIAKDSIDEFFKGIVAWTNVHRSKLKIKTLVLALIGDFMSGMIHDDLAENNAGTPQEEIIFIMDRLTAGIDFLLKNGDFKEIVIACCDGNHGRDTKFTRTAGRVKHSHEWLLYQFLAKLYRERGVKNIKFNITSSYHLYQDIYDWKFRIHHGDACRYLGGVGGLTIPINKAIFAWNQNIKVDFDILGHYHQSLYPGNFICNGSIIGYSPYALQIKASYERPQQAFLIVDSKRFITSYNKIIVR